MIERIVIAGVILALGIAAYYAFRWYKLWALTRVVSPAESQSARDPLLNDWIEGVPAVVYFSTPTCAPCKYQQMPAIAQLQQQLGANVQVITVDASVQPTDAERWGVFTAPTTFILDRLGKPYTVNYGVTESSTLKRQIEAAISV
jgi:thiol-disulfide isomerase/thioredoxin